LAVEYQSRQTCLGFLSEGLVSFGGVYASEPDLVLLLVVIQNRYRVAIANPDDPAGKWIAMRCRGNEDETEKESWPDG